MGWKFFKTKKYLPLTFTVKWPISISLEKSHILWICYKKWPVAPKLSIILKRKQKLSRIKFYPRKDPSHFIGSLLEHSVASQRVINNQRLWYFHCKIESQVIFFNRRFIENGTAEPFAFSCSWPNMTWIFRKRFHLRGALPEKIFVLIGRRIRRH